MTASAHTEPTSTPPKPRRLTRSRDERIVAGVCGGMARYFGVDPILVRIGFVLLTLAWGAGLVLYVAAAAITPGDDGSAPPIDDLMRDRSDRTAAMLGFALLALGGAILLERIDLWGDPGFFWIALLLTGGALLWFSRGRREPETVTMAAATTEEATEPETPVADRATEQLDEQADATLEQPAFSPPGGSSDDLPVPEPPDRGPLLLPIAAGVLLIAFGALGALDAGDVVDVPWAIAFAGGVVFVGALMVFGARRGRTGGLLALGIALGLSAAALAVVDIDIDGGIGDRQYEPTTVAQLRPDYELGIGQLDLDLGDVRFPPGETAIDARVGIGELLIEVPDDVAVEIEGSARAGELDVFGNENDGWDVDDHHLDPGYATATRKVTIDAEVGFGAIRVER